MGHATEWSRAELAAQRLRRHRHRLGRVVLLAAGAKAIGEVALISMVASAALDQGPVVDVLISAGVVVAFLLGMVAGMVLLLWMQRETG